jgi:hypothetical protein
MGASEKKNSDTYNASINQQQYRTKLRTGTKTYLNIRDPKNIKSSDNCSLSAR